MNQSELEDKIKKLEERILRLENKSLKIEPFKIEEVNDLARKIAEKIDKISTKDLVLIALHLKSKLTIAEIKNIITMWGWSPDTFFEKNFGTNLINVGLVQKNHDGADKKDYCLLTEKGKIIVEEILKKYELKSEYSS